MWTRISAFTDVEILIALDEAIDRADEVRDVTEWPEGYTTARLVCRMLDPELLGAVWGTDGVAKRLSQLAHRGLVASTYAVRPGPALWTITPFGDDAIEEASQL